MNRLVGDIPIEPLAAGRARRSRETERPRVLLVDDDERNLLAVATVLEDLGEVVLRARARKRLRHLLKGEFAVILLDVYMPGMDGYETAQIIRSRDQTKGIPIVFLSAVNKEAEHLLRGYAMGAVDYVFKPVDPIVLRSKVARVRRPVRQDQGDRAQGRAGAGAARRQSHAPMPSGCRPSRSCAVPSSARPRSSSRCRSCSISSPPTRGPRAPQLCQRRLRGDDRLQRSTMSRRTADICGRTASSRRPRHGASRAIEARRPAARIVGRISLAVRRRRATSISSTRRCCSAMPTAGRSNLPAR